MKRVKFIHAADLHLDSPMVGLQYLPQQIFSRLQESTFQALQALVNKAISEAVDFVILAGDLFDSEDRSIKAQTRLRKQMERLYMEGIPVFAIHGNHDHLGGTWAHIEMPDNVHFFSECVEVKVQIATNGTRVHLYGFSYGSKHVFERRIGDYKKVEGADFHIGILHGNMEGSNDHGNYAPFSLSELLDKNYDYWALGHIHKRSVLSHSPPIIYPGNTQGRNKKETGVKGGYIVTLDEAGAKYDFFDTSDCIWIEKQIDASEYMNFDQLYAACKKCLEEERELHKCKLVTIHLKQLAKNRFGKEENILFDLLELLQEEEKEEVSFVWPYVLKTEELVEWNRQTLASQTDFYGELFQLSESAYDIKNSLDALYQHPLARKYLTPLNELEEEQLIDKAESYLIEQLLKE